MLVYSTCSNNAPFRKKFISKKYKQSRPRKRRRRVSPIAPLNRQIVVPNHETAVAIIGFGRPWRW
ncbi:MAG TPA: hypothetical protein VEW72_09365 [Burkholderiales bacterium]|nr:hypothetical protein [Burkholderiales bacterium]